MSDRERQIDQLYQLPLSGFTPARNALAKTLKGDDAARVRALTKPTAVPWAVNQLYWRRRSTYDRLVAAGRALRDAQIAALSQRGGDVGHLNDAHKKALADAVRDTLALASADGITPSTDQLARMLEMLSLLPPSADAPGRYTELKQSSGLEAFAGITPTEETAEEAGAPARALHARERSTGASQRLLVAVPDPEAGRRRAEEAAAARKRSEENVKAAARALDEARRREEAAQRQVVHAQEALEQSQTALEVARRERRAASEALVAAKALA